MAPTDSRRTHLHLFFCSWVHETRGFRAADAAIEAGLADQAVFVGHCAEGLPAHQKIDERRSIRRIGVRPALPGSPRLLRALSLPRWWRCVVRTQSSNDIAQVIVHSIAALPAGVMLARRSGAGLLYDAQELETEREGWNPFIRFLARRFERFCIRRCDHTTVVNDSIKRWYEEAYPGLSVSTVRNVSDIPEVIGPSRLRANLGISSEPVLYVYCGLLDQGRGLSEMVEAFAGLDDDHHLAIIGYGPLEADIRAAAERHRNVHFHPAVKQSELISLMSGADVGVFLATGRSMSYQNALPNKVFEYSASRLALLVSDGPELKRFASEHPLAKSIPVSIQNVRNAVRGWSAEAIRTGRATMQFQPPSWRQEKARVLEAFAIVNERRMARASDARR